MSRNAAGPAEEGGHQQQVKNSLLRQVNRNAAWPAERGGHQHQAPKVGEKAKKSLLRQMN